MRLSLGLSMHVTIALVNVAFIFNAICSTTRERQLPSGLEVLIGDDQKSGSDLGPVSRVKEFLRGSRTGCQYR